MPAEQRGLEGDGRGGSAARPGREGIEERPDRQTIQRSRQRHRDPPASPRGTFHRNLPFGVWQLKICNLHLYLPIAWRLI